jgi:hypothetical protein
MPATHPTKTVQRRLVRQNDSGATAKQPASPAFQTTTRCFRRWIGQSHDDAAAADDSGCMAQDIGGRLRHWRSGIAGTCTQVAATFRWGDCLLVFQAEAVDHLRPAKTGGRVDVA